ncbi:MAG: FkbM family methyltransferase [Bryobacteraceae bacterium]
MRWRSRIVRAKLSGRLPALPWNGLPNVLGQRFENWDPAYFAAPVEGVDDGGLIAYETPFGQFYGPPQERNAVSTVVVESLCRIYHRPPVMIHPGDVVVDLGAHLGTFTRVALLSGARLVLAFEANVLNAKCFRKTFQKEIAEGKVVVIETPVWSERGMVRFSGDGLVGQIGETGDLRQAVAIDDVVQELGIDRVDFIKTDIEGAERHALRGAARMLSTNAPQLAVSSYHYPDDPAVLRDIVTKYHSYRVTFDKGRKRMFCYPISDRLLRNP